MSYFPDQKTSDELGYLPARDSESFVESLDKVGDEVAPGVVVERRSILELPLMATALLAGGLLAPLAAQDRAAAKGASQDGRAPIGKKPKPSPFAPLSFDAMLEELQPLAEGIIRAKDANEEAYLNSIASMLTRLKRDSIPRRVRRRPLAIFQLRLAPNAAIPWHDHRNYNGVILGLEGEMRIRNYEVVEPKTAKDGQEQIAHVGTTPVPPSGQDFTIRETVDARITPGRVSTLARRRDNIHDLRAGDRGGVVLDCFTFFGKGAGSHYLEVDDEAIDAKARLYRARWPQKRKARSKKKRRSG